MKRKTDIRAIEAALKKAGRDAVSGPRELRAGKFIARDASSGKFVAPKAVSAHGMQHKK